MTTHAAQRVVHDIVAALFPTVASLTLADWNHVVAMVCALLGAIYLVYRWRGEVIDRRRRNLRKVD